MNKYTIILGSISLVIICLLGFYIKALKSDLKVAETNLNIAINSNITLEKSLNELQKRHEEELLRLEESNKQILKLKDELKGIYYYVDNSKDDFITTFRNVVDRLWTINNNDTNKDNK